MKVVRLLGNSEVAVEDVPEPIREPGKLLIDVKASGICGSEMGGYRRAEPHRSNGGHEVVGVVRDAGESERFKVGDRIGVHAVWGCGDCLDCADGRYTHCANLRHSGGAHAERIVAPDHVCMKLPDDMPFDVGVLATGDGMGVPYRVSQRLGDTSGRWVCVTGAGPVGLGNVIAQSFLGARVVVVDMNPYRLELAEKCGAERIVNLQETDAVEAVKEITSGGPTVSIEAAGKPDALRFLLNVSRKGATIMAVGEQGELPISPSRDLIHRDITLMGSLYYHYADYPGMLAMCADGLPIGRMITDHFALSDAPEAFRKFADGEAGKVILEP